MLAHWPRFLGVNGVFQVVFELYIELIVNMAKVKNKSRPSADRIYKKKEKIGGKKPMNPFEVHVNKEKLKVIGKKQKNDRGLPGVSRAKSIEKRKYTLLKEYKVQNKSNRFMDKRIGEKDHNMTGEDKAMARFTAVRVKAHNKKNIFNLADDEVLTHKGQTLNEIERFDDPRSDDESLEGDSGNLERDFVGEAHFGGGMLKKTGVEGAKSHKDLIDQLIADSKKRKAEKQKVKEATLELTEKLDADWKDLLPLVNKNKKTADHKAAEKSKMDDYDRVMRELTFEARGTVSDRLKTENEVAKEEKERLEQLEKDRLERMQGFVKSNDGKSNHRSADDLDDDTVYEEDPDYTLSYNEEGQSNLKVEADINGKTLEVNEQSEKVISDNEIKEQDEDSSDEELESDSEDDLSDLKQETSESEESDAEENKIIFDKPPAEDYKQTDVKNDDTEIVDAQEKTKIELVHKEIMEKAMNELPYTFNLPDSYEGLLKVFENQSSSHQSVILERIIKCNHPSLAKGNKDSLGLLFAYLLQYLNDLFAENLQKDSIKNSFEIFRILVPQIYELAQLNPENAHNSLLEVIKEKHQEYRKKPEKHPGLEVILFLKLVSILFSTSDFRHQVVTPCFIFIEQMLNKCRKRNKRDICYGIFLTTLILEYTLISRRYLPAAINFLSGLLHMAVPKTGVRVVKVVPPFKSTSNLLVLLENFSLESFESYLIESSDILDTSVEENFKVKTIYTVVKLLEEFHNNLKELPSREDIFEPVLRYLELIPSANYPKEVRSTTEELINILRKAKDERKLSFIVMEAKRPKALRLYEPKIEEVYDVKRYKVQSREKAERSKLLHKLKNEKKGALREIRRDKAFLGRVKINQQIKSDRDRREKVKRIYAEASMQQSELNELDRKKKRKK